jgi:hypothetical protein
MDGIEATVRTSLTALPSRSGTGSGSCRPGPGTRVPSIPHSSLGEAGRRFPTARSEVRSTARKSRGDA